MQKIVKIGCLSVVVIAVVLIIGSLIAFSLPSLETDELAKIVQDKAKLRIGADLEIVDFESSGPTFMHSDYYEVYVVKMPPEVHNSLVSDIEHGIRREWEDLDGTYQLSIEAEGRYDTSFVFFFYSNKSEMEIQIIED